MFTVYVNGKFFPALSCANFFVIYMYGDFVLGNRLWKSLEMKY